MYVAGFLLLLGPLITVHELGHYLVGRWFGVRAEVFSIGFGKEIAGRTDRHGTRWRLSLLPLGGYVQFKGDMNPASVPDPEAVVEPGSFQGAALWKRALIVAAGPVTNLLVAIGILAALFTIYGQQVITNPEASTEIGAFAEGSAAEAAGMEVGDRIVAIDGEAVTEFNDIVRAIELYPGRDLIITALRDGRERTFAMTAARATREDGFGNTSVVGRIGIAPAALEVAFQRVPLIEAIPLATATCWDITKMMVTGIRQIVTGERSIKELGGPVKIAKYSGEQLSLGITPFAFFVALISLNLAFINFLPIPALDGGHLAFYAAEAIRRKPAGPEATEWAYRFGIVFVLVFMVVVTWNDITDLLPFG
ncbi:RIP metalloprotease RseP [Qipengyuania nanhaisediminis]|uniref:RIP metalloprotease RseP n=1 Tax=Qipengyuania nanhaisediminis TaxID=604088 RepID=UPI0038B28890